jgi:hypothetical protein
VARIVRRAVDASAREAEAKLAAKPGPTGGAS